MVGTPVLSNRPARALAAPDDISPPEPRCRELALPDCFRCVLARVAALLLLAFVSWARPAVATEDGRPPARDPGTAARGVGGALLLLSFLVALPLPLATVAPTTTPAPAQSPAEARRAPQQPARQLARSDRDKR